MAVERSYTDDTTALDIVPGHILFARCACGHRRSLTCGLWPREMQAAPLRRLAPRMVCNACGARAPTIYLEGVVGRGGAVAVTWAWPA